MADFNGQLIGGDLDEDWAFQSSLSTDELALLQFADTLSQAMLDPYDEATDTIAILCPFPNPAIDVITLPIQNNLRTGLKGGIVNQNMEVLSQFQLPLEKANTLNLIALDISDPAFEPGQLYRIYFGFSFRDRPLALVGYGDIQIQP